MRLETTSNNSLRAGLPYFPSFPSWWRAASPRSLCLLPHTAREGCVLLPGTEHPKAPLAVLNALIFLIELPVSVLLIPFGHLAQPPQTSAPPLGWAAMVSADILLKSVSEEPDANPPLLLQESSWGPDLPCARGQHYRMVLRWVFCSPVRFLGASGSIWSLPGLHTPPMPREERSPMCQGGLRFRKPCSWRLLWEGW